jgi:hypothetical protein
VNLEEQWQGWRSRFDRTHNGVVRLFHDRAIWRTILAMLDANPRVLRGGFGEYWLGSCYTDSLLTGIRRETDGDSRSTGLLRSLNSLVSTPRMAARTWYQQQIRQRDHQGWDESALAELDAGFNRFAAAGEPFADSARVRQDIAALDAVVARVNAYTSKTIAHRDASLLRGVPAPAVTWAELDDALDAVENIHRKYYRLCHPGESLGGLTPLISPGWIQMFETAWMPPGFTMPDHFDFDPAWTNG